MNNLLTKSALLLTIHFLSGQCATVRAQEVTPIARTEHSQNSLNELVDKRSALLVVLRSGIVNARDNERAIIEMVLKADPRPRGRYQWIYGTLAKRLNAYIRRYKSLTAATELANADYVIFFNLLQYRNLLNSIYPYGELFVIVKGEPDLKKSPRIIWRSKKVLYSGDAISELIRELKLLRRED